MNVAIILAAGGGLRLGGEPPKCFKTLSGSRMIVSYPLTMFENHPRIHHVIVTTPREIMPAPIVAATDRVTFIEGGETRQRSVYIALSNCPSGTSKVIIHDGCRPFVSMDMIDRVLAALEDGPAVNTICPSTDTIVWHPTSNFMQIPNRDEYFIGQTPQGFRYRALREVYSMALEEGAIDDFVEDIGLFVRYSQIAPIAVLGDPSNIKVTTPRDLWLAEMIAEERYGTEEEAGIEWTRTLTEVNLKV